MKPKPIKLTDFQKLTADQQIHLNDIIDWVVESLETKYVAGQQQHGGNIWLKHGMLSHIEAELLDLVVYVRTLRKQLEDAQFSKAPSEICGPAQE